MLTTGRGCRQSKSQHIPNDRLADIIGYTDSSIDFGYSYSWIPSKFFPDCQFEGAVLYKTIVLPSMVVAWNERLCQLR